MTERKRDRLSRRDFFKVSAGLAAGACAAARSGPERQSNRPLTIELAGGDNYQPFWRIRNPNSTALPFRVELPERNASGNLLDTRVEEPANRYSLYDIFKDMTMVPTEGEIILDYPPLRGGRQINPQVQILKHSYLTETLGNRAAYPDEFQVKPRVLSGGRQINFDLEATDKLQGKLLIQAQIVFLNKGWVVKEITTLPNEFHDLTAGERFSSPSLNLVGSDIPQYSSYKLNFVGLAHP